MTKEEFCERMLKDQERLKKKREADYLDYVKGAIQRMKRRRNKG
jgi:hypothetical protein